MAGHGGASLPTRGAWIETLTGYYGYIGGASLPTRGAWIETSTNLVSIVVNNVAPHAGSVD